jgi:hypothetical protein
MLISVVVCLASFFALIALLRRKRVSLGFPIAYLGSLLLIHVPGAVGALVDYRNVLTDKDFTAVGIAFTAIASVCFVIGVALSQRRAVKLPVQRAPRVQFWNFCLMGGALVSTLSYIVKIPSLGAMLQKGGPIWMIGAMCGLRAAMKRRDVAATWRWGLTLALYPLLMLLLGGFLSYGSMVAIIVLSAIAVTARSMTRIVFGVTVLTYFGMSVFFGYFQHRGEIRSAVWGGEATEARISASLGAIKDMEFFDPGNVQHLQALDLRLNQNYFVGLAAARIDAGLNDYLYGKTIWQGMLAVIPRALWPDKPIIAGSGNIVGDATGLQLSSTTSFGVGNVMEFHINFGIPGLIFGFLLFGYVLGLIDICAAMAETSGDFKRLLIYFLIEVAIIQPNGSMVEVMGGAAAAAAAGFAWSLAWQKWPKPRVRSVPAAGPGAPPRGPNQLVPSS